MYQLEFTRVYDYSGDDESVVIPVVHDNKIYLAPCDPA